MRSPHRADVAIVGAGIVGLALAFELQRCGRSVTLVERDVPGQGATWAAGGMLAPVSEAELERPELIALGRDSLARFPEFVRRVETESGMPCGYRDEGTLWVARDRDDMEELRHLAETLTARDLPWQRVTAAELREAEPRLSHRVVGGLRIPSDHQVDPRALARSLERAVVVAGGQVLGGTEVGAIDARSGAVHLEARRREDGARVAIEAGQVVVAAGVWAGGGLHPALRSLELRPVKGQLIRLHGEPLLRHVVRTPEVYLIPRHDGELLLGATSEEMGFDSTPTAGAVLELLRQTWRILPGIDELRFDDVSVGLRSATPDHLPAIGPLGPGGLFSAVGHFRNGVLLAPATAIHLARWMVQGERPAALAAFDPRRFSPAGGGAREVGVKGGA